MSDLLVLILAAPFVAAFLMGFSSSRDGFSAARLALFLSMGMAALALPLVWAGSVSTGSLEWIRLPGADTPIDLRLSTDPLSSWLVLLVTWLVPAALWGNRRALGDRMREFAVCAFAMQGAMIGVLLAADLVLFYVFFEAMLIPAALLVAIFGGRDRRRAGLQFLLYSMIGSAPLLLAVWYLAAVVGVTSIDALPSAVAVLPGEVRAALFWSFALAFAVKVPLVPLHSWQADLYQQASAGGAALLAGAMSKIGLFGFLQLVVPVFPVEVELHGEVFVMMGIASVVAGALLALAQTDIRRLLAFSSLSHLGLMVAAIFTEDPFARTGVVISMLAHGLSSAGLFVLMGTLERWAGTHHIDDFGDLARRAPYFATLFFATVLTAVSLPGTAGFVGEFLILLGIWRQHGVVFALLAAITVVLSAAYMLRLVQRVVFGRPAALDFDNRGDLHIGEAFSVAPLLVLSVVLGFFPWPVTRTLTPEALRLAPPQAIPNPQPLTLLPEDEGDATSR